MANAEDTRAKRCKCCSRWKAKRTEADNSDRTICQQWPLVPGPLVRPLLLAISVDPDEMVQQVADYVLGDLYAESAKRASHNDSGRELCALQEMIHPGAGHLHPTKSWHTR